MLICIVAACHHAPFLSSTVEPWPAPRIKPPGFMENGLFSAGANGPSGLSDT